MSISEAQLGYSQLLWLRFYARQTMTVLMDGLESAFEAFGGAPEELLFDQMRAVVLSDDRAAGGGLVLNAEFLRFATHWGFVPRSCRPYRARIAHCDAVEWGHPHHQVASRGEFGQNCRQASWDHSMKTLSAKDAKYGFGRLIEFARAEPVSVADRGGRL